MCFILIAAIFMIWTSAVAGYRGYNEQLGWNMGARNRLTQVPTDIPAEAKKVLLYTNQITTLESGVFSHLSVCSSVCIKNSTGVAHPG